VLGKLDKGMSSAAVGHQCVEKELMVSFIK